MRGMVVVAALALVAAPARGQDAPARCGPMAIAIVVEGHTLFVWPEGRFQHLQRAIDAFAHVGPPGSKAELIVYGNQPATKLPLGDLSRLSGAALGKVSDYDRFTARQLADGVDVAVRDLERSGMQGVIVVIGDGADTNPDNKNRLAAVRRELSSKHIDAWALYEDSGDPDLESDVTIVKALVGPNLRVAGGDADLEPAAAAIATQIASAPVCPPGGVNPKPCYAPVHDGFPWLWFFVGTAALSMIILSIAARVVARRRRERLASMIVRP